MKKRLEQLLIQIREEETRGMEFKCRDYWHLNYLYNEYFRLIELINKEDM